MQIADLVLPVFAVIVTGWVLGAIGYVPRALAENLIQFAYRVAMPGLLFVTIAQEPARALFAWRFLLAFGGGSLICFVAVFAVFLLRSGNGLASSTMHGIAAAMTNTGFVALPILRAVYGPHAVLPAAIATVFVAAVMFPLAVVLLEIDGTSGQGAQHGPLTLVRHILLDPMVLPTLLGLAWAVLGFPLPGPVAAYMNILADALTACALFAIGLGLSLGDLRANFGSAVVLGAVKLVAMPTLVLGLSLALGLDPLNLIAAVVCAAVPTAKTVYILAGAYRRDEAMVAATISITTLFSVVTLLAWMYLLSGYSARLAGP
jgi:malonate transporter and related proteins